MTRRRILIALACVATLLGAALGAALLVRHRAATSLAPVARLQRPTPSPSPSPTPSPTPSPPPPPTPAPTPLVQPVADLHVDAVDTPLHLDIPAIGVSIPVAAVGLKSDSSMDAPFGPPDSIVWQEGFWFRGGAEPGQLGTATIAGHLDDTLGRPGAFGRLRALGPGDTVDVRDARTQQTAHFRIVEADVYSVGEANTAAVLTRIFGADAVAGRPAGTTPDSQSRLTLITCAGTFRGSAGYDHRIVDYAVRIG